MKEKIENFVEEGAFEYIINKALGTKPICSVYLAGKIKPNDWRQYFFDMRDRFWGFDYYANPEDIEKLKNTYVEFYYDKHILITGPFFLSCDHSCYHGEGSHGIGTNKVACSGEKSFTQEQTVDICKQQIKNADILFAYINDDTCYGTLLEIGYAKGIGKKVIVVFDSIKRQQNMWFVAQNADYCFVLE